MKILDIDSLATVTRQVRLKGVLHDVKEITVQGFVDSIVAAEKLLDEQKAGKHKKVVNTAAQATEGVRTSVESIIGSIPTLTKDDIHGMGVSAMMLLLAFIRGEHDPDATTAEDAPATGGEGGDEAAQGKQD